MNLKKYLSAVLLAAITLALCAYQAPPDISEKPRYKNEIIIKYKELAAALGSGSSGALMVNPPAMEKGFVFVKPLEKSGYLRLVKYSGSEAILDVISRLKTDARIEYAEPNYLRYALYTPYPVPDDPAYQDGVTQWGYAKIKADQALSNGLINTAKNKTVIVAVVDTGVSKAVLFHEDLAGMTITGYNVITPPADPDDDNYWDSDGNSTVGHGTFIAGIIAANTGNSIGMAGTAGLEAAMTSKILIMPIKALDYAGEGNDADIYNGIIWAVDHGANVINCSFGGIDESITLRNAITYAASRGTLVIAASGNSNSKTFYPAAFSEVIAVASTDINDRKSAFSNYGKIDVAAPGENIYSCTRNWGVPPGDSDNRHYDSGSGTSFAAPFVSGLAALIFLNRDNITAENVRTVIEQTSDDVEAPGYDTLTGWGRINIARALASDFNPVTSVKTYNWPNPFSPAREAFTNITIRLTEISDITVEIYDSGGELVWSKNIGKNSLIRGYNTLRWDGTNSDNKKVSNGVYFYVIKNPGIIGKNKIAVLN